MVKIIAHSPTLKAAGCFPTRIVLCTKLNQDETVYEYVVWTEIFYYDGDHQSYHQGNYFPVRGEKVKALNDAFAQFNHRSQIHMNQILCADTVI